MKSDDYAAVRQVNADSSAKSPDHQIFFSNAVASPASAERSTSPVDAVDRAMLGVVAADARITNQRLADRVGVAPSTALARLRSLRARGVIRGFHAEVDLAALGRPLQALIAVRLAVHAREQIDAFTDAVGQLPGVLMVFHLDRRDRLPGVGRGRRRPGPEGVRRRPSRHPPVGIPRRDLADLRAPAAAPGSGARRTRHEDGGARSRARDDDLHRDERARARRPARSISARASPTPTARRR